MSFYEVEAVPDLTAQIMGLKNEETSLWLQANALLEQAKKYEPMAPLKLKLKSDARDLKIKLEEVQRKIQELAALQKTNAVHPQGTGDAPMSDNEASHKADSGAEDTKSGATDDSAGTPDKPSTGAEHAQDQGDTTDNETGTHGHPTTGWEDAQGEGAGAGDEGWSAGEPPGESETTKDKNDGTDDPAGTKDQPFKTEGALEPLQNKDETVTAAPPRGKSNEFRKEVVVQYISGDQKITFGRLDRAKDKNEVIVQLCCRVKGSDDPFFGLWIQFQRKSQEGYIHGKKLVEAKFLRDYSFRYTTDFSEDEQQEILSGLPSKHHEKFKDGFKNKTLCRVDFNYESKRIRIDHYPWPFEAIDTEQQNLYDGLATLKTCQKFSAFIWMYPDILAHLHYVSEHQAKHKPFTDHWLHKYKDGYDA